MADGGASRATSVEADAAGDPPPALRTEGIRKQFGRLVALSNIDLTLERGEVHAVLGCNGAGKTTLMRILSGIIRPDAGDISVDGRKVVINSAKDAVRLGIGMVHQDHSLVPAMTVAENVHLGWADTPAVARSRRLVDRTRELATRYGVHLDPTALVSELSVAEQQNLAIIRTLIREPKIIILDEPTAVLTPVEAQALFTMMRDVAEDDRAVVFITHKLYEAIEVAHTVTILRDGRCVASMGAAESDVDELAEMMVGHEVESIQRRVAPRGEPVLQAEGLKANGDRGERALHDVSFTLHAGEIVGVLAVAGNGQRELSEVLTGLRPLTGGRIELNGEDFSRARPWDYVRAGVGHVPDDRMTTGVALDATVEANCILKVAGKPEYKSGPLLRWSAARRYAKELVTVSQARVPAMDAPMRQLSGGNIQRILVRREIDSGRRLLVLAYPTRGLDVDASQRVWEDVLRATAEGTGVLLISEDVDEVLMLADTVIVLYRGKVAGALTRAEATRDKIGLMMIGGEERERARDVAGIAHGE